MAKSFRMRSYEKPGVESVIVNLLAPRSGNSNAILRQPTN